MLKYYDLKEAVSELKKRQRDDVLIKAVNTFLNLDPYHPCPIPQGMFGFLARHIATARFEDIQFVQRCKAIGLRPIFLEYQEDVFCSNNSSKVRLIKLIAYDGMGKRKGPRLKNIYVVENIRAIEKIPLLHIETKWGEGLVEFHHRLHSKLGKIDIIDLSKWLKSIGPAVRYYKYLFTAFLTRGILFESFESPGFLDLDLFKKIVVIPAVEFVKNIFGHDPLIVYHPISCTIDGLELNEDQILKWYPLSFIQDTLIYI